MSDSSFSQHWDLIVIGGGAAGFFSAISAAEHAASPLKILILERGSQVLQKVKISGGGRCNVTHDCLEPRLLTAHYPRGVKSLMGPFHHFGPRDTIAWFTERGVELKVEEDGRMFPVTDSSQTIITCLTEAAEEYGIEVRKKTGVAELKSLTEGYEVITDGDDVLTAAHLVLATGGTRLAAGAKLATDLEHTLIPAVPSLFTFAIDHPLLDGLEGLSVNPAHVKILGTQYSNRGPLLITHWGVSGPGVLKLSALAARDLADCDYTFTLEVDWCPDLDLKKLFSLKRKEWGRRHVATRSPLASIPKRLWAQICEQADIQAEQTWAQLTSATELVLTELLRTCRLPVTGKSMNKDEFVTCGGVELKEVNMKTMESKLQANVHFAGELLNIDGVTGGFNFQNAWTSGFLAGRAIAEKVKLGYK